MIDNKLKEKADFFLKISTMENSGIPLIQAIEAQLPNKNTALNKTFSRLLTDLKRGSTFAAAGLRSGIFTNIDNLIIKTATESGKLDEALKRLAAQYEMRFKLTQTIKSKLVFPSAIFILAVFIAPIPGLATGMISTGDYINATVFFLIKLSIVIYLLIKLPRILKNTGFSSLVDRLILKPPIIGKLYIKHQITRFIETLGMLLQAGIPALDAMPKAVGTIDNVIIKNSFDPVIKKLKSHATLTDALAINTYLSNDANQHIKAGEVSGRLDESLIHYGEMTRAEVTSSFKQIAIWIPRLIYGIICAYIIHSLFIS